MAQRIESLTTTDKSKDFPKITAFFDGTEYIFERTVQLLKRIFQLTIELLVESKILVLVIVGLIILVIELYRFIQFLLVPH